MNTIWKNKSSHLLKEFSMLF